MKKADAEKRIIAEWRSLPRAERQTDAQAAAFAMKIKDKYPFKGSGDPYQTIKAMVQRHLSLTKGLD